MKTEIIKIATFACMVLILGIQALLQGSWRVPEKRSVGTKNDQQGHF